VVYFFQQSKIILKAIK